MASIIHAEIVGTRMAEEGSGGITFNSTSYSVLVFYDSGFVDLVEGSASQIKQFLPYMKPSRDNRQLEQFLKQLLEQSLEQFETKLKSDISSIVKQAIDNMLYESRNPIPMGITGKSGTEAKSILEKAGFSVEYKPVVPNDTPGIVMECNRKPNAPMTVVLSMKYDMPSVEGLFIDDAIQKMQTAGFITSIKRIVDSSAENDTVIKVDREGDGLNAVLWANVNFNQAQAFAERIENETSMVGIWQEWDKLGLTTMYPSLSEYIAKLRDLERKYGAIPNIDEKKTEIVKKLQIES